MMHWFQFINTNNDDLDNEIKRDAVEKLLRQLKSFYFTASNKFL